MIMTVILYVSVWSNTTRLLDVSINHLIPILKYLIIRHYCYIVFGLHDCSNNLPRHLTFDCIIFVLACADSNKIIVHDTLYEVRVVKNLYMKGKC